MPLIPHSRPTVGSAEEKAVRQVIQRKRLAQGIECEKLESALSSGVGHRYGVTVASGTAALHLALLALQMKPRQRIAIPSYACTALLHAVRLVGGRPILTDVDPLTGNMRVEDAKLAVRAGAAAFIVPHLFGYPADVVGIERLGVPVIEDCAQCVGASVAKRPVGGLTAISIFSFYATKVLGAGEGGMVCTSDPRMAQRVRELRAYDNQEELIPRFNYKLSDLHAAMARVQLKRLPSFLRRRRKLAETYRRNLSGLAIDLPPRASSGVSPIFYRFVIGTDQREKLMARLAQAGVHAARPVYRPLHTYLGLKGYPNTARFYARAVSLPIFPSLGLFDVRYVCRQVEEGLTV